jgi:hypothetical protein
MTENLSNPALLIDDKAELRAPQPEIPGVVVIGLDDPLTRQGDSFPDVSYHAFRSASGKDFMFNEFFAGETTGVGNDMFGVGLYTAEKGLADKYAASFGVDGGITRIMPYKARMIDQSSPELNDQIHPDLVPKFMAYLNENRGAAYTDAETSRVAFNRYMAQAKPSFLSTFDERDAIQKQLGSDAKVMDGLVRRRNTQTILLYAQTYPGKYKLSLNQMLQKVLPGTAGQRYPMDYAATQGFLMDQGIDGMLVSLRASVDPNTDNRAAVYWRLDHVGDETVWRHRQSAQKTVGNIGRQLVSHIGAETDNNQEYSSLRGDKRLGISEATAVRNAFVGGVAFTPKDGRDMWRQVTQEKVNPLKLIEFMAECSPAVGRLMSAGVGVWEGYRLHEHTQAVLGQYERYTAERLGEGEDHKLVHGLVRTALLLQDIGKPLAVTLASKAEQKAYNMEIASSILSSTPLKPKVQSLIIDLIGQDYIGTAIKTGNEQKIHEIGPKITAFTDKHKDTLAPKDVYEIMKVLYICDASAYTSKARYYSVEQAKYVKCQPSFDKLFDFAERSSRMRPAAGPRDVMRRLRRYVPQ